jgi:nitrogen fixation/metabolism regulation signal transduction histidine kinase
MGKAGVGAVRAGILQRRGDESFAKKIKAEHVSRVFAPVMLTAILLIIIFTIALTAAFWFFVIRRILFLTEFTEKMSFGELEIEVPVRSEDEIGHLEETLERMRANLREAIERLKDRLKRR